MEALLEKEGQVESWNDDRLDELSQTMKSGFAKSEREMKEGFARVEEGFAEINRKIDRLPTREEIDHRFEAAHRETNQRFEATDRRIDRVSTRLEHMVWAMLVVGGGFLGNLLTDKI
jgi:uncharacterized sporulation protein YeaH/YhbH (DUF444 family)